MHVRPNNAVAHGEQERSAPALPVVLVLTQEEAQLLMGRLETARMASWEDPGGEGLHAALRELRAKPNGTATEDGSEVGQLETMARALLAQVALLARTSPFAVHAWRNTWNDCRSLQRQIDFRLSLLGDTPRTGQGG